VKKNNLTDMTVDQLIDRFAEIGVAQDDALWDGKYSVFNRLYREMDNVDAELRSRGRDARLALLQLYDHESAQVRLKAAKRTLGIAPDEARKLIEKISDSKIYPQAGEAGMTLDSLDEGIFKPD
jgi:hypothetical protein